MIRLPKLALIAAVSCMLVACSGGALEEELERVSADLNEANAAITTQEAELTELRQDLDEAKSRFSDLESSNIELTETHSETASNIENEISQIKEDKERISGEIEANTELIESMSGDIEALSQGLVDLRSQMENTGIVAKELPTSFDEDEQEALVSTLKDLWNDEDWTGLYDTLSDYGKLGSSVEDMDNLFPDFRSFCGEIGDMTFSNYEYLGEERGADFFSLIYLAEYGVGLGELEITIRSINGDWETVGFYYNCQGN